MYDGSCENGFIDFWLLYGRLVAFTEAAGVVTLVRARGHTMSIEGVGVDPFEWAVPEPETLGWPLSVFGCIPLGGS